MEETKCPDPEKWTDRIVRLFFNDLKPKGKKVVEKHLESCPACQRRMEALKASWGNEKERSAAERSRMKCPSREQIRRLWEATLSNYQETKVERHLRACEACQKVYDGIAAEGEAATYRAVAKQLRMEDPDNATKEDVDRAVRRNAAEGIMELSPDDDPSMLEIEDAARVLLEAMRLRPEATLSEEEKERMRKATGFLRINAVVEDGPGFRGPETN